MSRLTRTVTGGFMAVLALLIAVSGSSAASVATAPATAQAADCGVARPSAETAVSSYKALQTDLASTTSATFYLTTSLADSTSTTGGLIPAGTNGDTINLNGCTLTISNAGTGNAGINITSAPLTIEDLSTNHDGVLTSTGGAATTGVGANGIDTDTGGGAGIGTSGGPNATPPTPDTLTILSGTVNATGGSANTSADDPGSGAGIGGAGGGPTGGAGGNVTISGSAVVNATGGTATSGAGAGIGGGGGNGQIGGDGTAPGDAITLNGGSINATGGATTAVAPNFPAGPGIGGGTVGYGAIGNAAVLDSTGGSITATPGTTPGSDYPNGISASAGVEGGVYVSSGTTTVSASISGAISVQSGTLDLTSNELDLSYLKEDSDGTINVAAGDVLSVDALGSQLPLELDGAFTLPASSGLTVLSDYGEDTLVFDGTPTLAGSVTVDAGGGISAGPGGHVTLTTLTSPVTGTLGTQSGGTMTLPAAATIDPAGGLTSSGTLLIPDSTTVDISNQVDPPDGDGPATVESGGAIDLYGTLTGTGTLQNNGSIVLEGGQASIPGKGTGAGGQLTITDDIYDLNFNVPSPGSAPQSQWLYAPTLADGDETLPADPALTNYVSNGGWVVNGGDTTPPLSGYTLLTQNTVLNGSSEYLYLAGNYQYSGITVSQLENLAQGQVYTAQATVQGGSYFGSPTGTVTFFACGPTASAAACGAGAVEIGQPITVSPSVNDQSQASVTFTPTSPGVWCTYAAYSGDASNLSAGEGTPLNCETVTGSSSTGTAPTTVTKPVSSLNPSVGGEPIKLSTTVSSTNRAVESGEVAFFNASNTTLCIAEVIGGKAACDTASAPVGTDKITAVYEGNAYFAASPMSAVLTQTVTPNSSFTVVSSSVARASLNVKLKLSDAGTVRIAALVGERSFTSTTRTEKVRNNSTVTIKLSLATLRKLEKGHRASSKVKVLLRITFAPAGARAKAATKTKLVTLRVSQL